MESVEKNILTSCAPTILGVKQATLFSCPIAEARECSMTLLAYETLFRQKDIYFKPLYRCKNRLFIIAYRKSVLQNTLLKQNISAYLETIGYPSSKTTPTEEMLSYLVKRIRSTGSFPNEIGFFLGYPEEDVFGFIKYKGDNYKLCGYWKVYGNAEKAKDLFCKISKSYHIVQNIISSEASFKTILGAA